MTPRLLRFKKIHYYVIPLISLVVWWGMLIAMLSAWSIQGHPIYYFMGNSTQNPVYISDIGATNLQPLFISCAGFQAIFFVGTLAMDYWLRTHGERLQPFVSKRQPKLAIAAVISATIGQLGILFVAIFNTNSFHHVHISMVGVFIAFNFLACVFNFLNSFIFGNYPTRLSPYHEKVVFGKHRWQNLYMVSFFCKCVWLVCAAGFALAFGVLMKNGQLSLSATFEWTISFWYGLLLVFWGIDLFPSAVRHYRVSHPEIYGPEPPRTPITFNKEDQRSISTMGEPTFVGDVEQGNTVINSGTLASDRRSVYQDANSEIGQGFESSQNEPHNAISTLESHNFHKQTHLTPYPISPTIPQATVPQATVPQATVPQATVPQATVPQPAVPQPTYQVESSRPIENTSGSSYPSPVFKRYSKNEEEEV
jgi:hypothetical protein